MRVIISIIFLSLSLDSIACTIDTTYVYTNFDQVVDESSAVFRGTITEIIGYDSSAPKASLEKVVVTSARNETSILSKLLIIEVTERYKGSRTKYIVEAGTMCMSFSVGDDYVFFVKNNISIVYQSILIEKPAIALLSRLEPVANPRP